MQLINIIPLPSRFECEFAPGKKQGQYQKKVKGCLYTQCIKWLNKQRQCTYLHAKAFALWSSLFSFSFVLLSVYLSSRTRYWSSITLSLLISFIRTRLPRGLSPPPAWIRPGHAGEWWGCNKHVIGSRTKDKDNSTLIKRPGTSRNSKITRY
jgi:hypothetical protein